MTKTIPLTQGKFAIVDDDMYEWASQYKWYAVRDGNRWYAARKTGKGLSARATFLHREIISAPHGIFVDHINGDGLVCTRLNMRLATRTENNRNSRLRSNNTSGYKGVGLDKGKWYASIKVNGKPMYLGRFADPETAARAYDAAAKKYYGEFARTNF